MTQLSTFDLFFLSPPLQTPLFAACEVSNHTSDTGKCQSVSLSERRFFFKDLLVCQRCHSLTTRTLWEAGTACCVNKDTLEKLKGFILQAGDSPERNTLKAKSHHFDKASLLLSFHAEFSRNQRNFKGKKNKKTIDLKGERIKGGEEFIQPHNVGWTRSLNMTDDKRVNIEILTLNEDAETFRADFHG